MDENQPVDQTEFVYRRIPRIYFQAGVPVLFRITAFRPTSQDSTGLSVYRAGFLQPVDILADLQTSKQNDYFVVRLAVQDLQWLGLTVVPEPDPNGPPGHAVIPELSWQAYQANKERLKDIQLELAKLATAAILHQPS